MRFQSTRRASLPFLPERSAAKRRQKLGRDKRAQRSEHAQGGQPDTDRGSLYQRDDGTTVETFSYDALGNLTQVARNNGTTIDYLIDAEGHRVGKQIDGALDKQYVWSGALRIAAELDGTGQVTSRFIYGSKVNVPDLIVKPDAVNGDKLYRVITDHLGSPIYVVNIADPSDVLLNATYDEWGRVESYTSSTGAWPIPFGFAGGLYDEDTGLVRFGARDYDPVVGRWTAKDPIRFDGRQVNLYVYVGDDPVNHIDPQGNEGLFTSFNLEFGAIAQWTRSYGILDVGSRSGSLGYKQDSFMVGPGGSTGISGQLGYFEGSPNEFRDATTIHFGLSLVGINFLVNDWRLRGVSLGAGFGLDLGLLWTGKSRVEIAKPGCPIPR